MRIISGRNRSRVLLSPEGMVTRPITDRVKLALFNMLMGATEEAVVADLFCGTGSMGLEALSRGARLCYFADADASALERLKRNIQALGEGERSRVWRGDILARLAGWLTEVQEKIDLAFVDPPYEMVQTWDWAQAGAAIFGPLAGKLSPDGSVIFRCRREAKVPGVLAGLRVRRRRDYGKMALFFLGPESGSS